MRTSPPSPTRPPASRISIPAQPSLPGAASPQALLPNASSTGEGTAAPKSSAESTNRRALLAHFSPQTDNSATKKLLSVFQERIRQYENDLKDVVSHLPEPQRSNTVQDARNYIAKLSPWISTEYSKYSDQNPPSKWDADAVDRLLKFDLAALKKEVSGERSAMEPTPLSFLFQLASVPPIREFPCDIRISAKKINAGDFPRSTVKLDLNGNYLQKLDGELPPGLMFLDLTRNELTAMPQGFASFENTGKTYEIFRPKFDKEEPKLSPNVLQVKIDGNPIARDSRAVLFKFKSNWETWLKTRGENTPEDAKKMLQNISADLKIYDPSQSATLNYGREDFVRSLGQMNQLRSELDDESRAAIQDIASSILMHISRCRTARPNYQVFDDLVNDLSLLAERKNLDNDELTFSFLQEDIKTCNFEKYTLTTTTQSAWYGTTPGIPNKAQKILADIDKLEKLLERKDDPPSETVKQSIRQIASSILAKLGMVTDAPEGLNPMELKEHIQSVVDTWKTESDLEAAKKQRNWGDYAGGH